MLFYFAFHYCFESSYTLLVVSLFPSKLLFSIWVDREENKEGKKEDNMLQEKKKKRKKQQLPPPLLSYNNASRQRRMVPQDSFQKIQNDLIILKCFRDNLNSLSISVF